MMVVLGKNNTKFITDELKLATMKGFTIAELVVVISLLAIIILFVFGVLISNNRFFKTQSGEIRAINSTREVADKINESARQAVAIATTHTYSSVVYNTSATLVVFQVPSVDSSENIIDSVYDYIIVGQDPSDSSRLLMIVSPDNTSSRKNRVLEISNKLSAIQFVYDDANISLAKNIIYDVTITEEAANSAIEHVTGSATLRN